MQPKLLKQINGFSTKEVMLASLLGIHARIFKGAIVHSTFALNTLAVPCFTMIELCIYANFYCDANCMKAHEALVLCTQ